MSTESSKQLADLDAQIKDLKDQLGTGATQALPKTSLPSWWSATDAMTISSAVLCFGVVILVLAAWLINKGRTPESVLRIFGTILIIVAGLFLVVAGYSSQQIAPVMGLLGTIAGYLLGKSENKGGPRQEHGSKDDDTPA